MPSVAIVLGRFLPVHNGHLYLLSGALQTCDALLILVRSRRQDPYPAELRVRWLSSSLSGPVHIEIIPEERPVDPRSATDLRAWRDRVEEALPQGWRGWSRVVHAGEHHAAPLAEALGARFEAVDRRIFPISGTEIRANPAAHLASLPPSVQNDFR